MKQPRPPHAKSRKPAGSGRPARKPDGKPRNLTGKSDSRSEPTTASARSDRPSVAPRSGQSFGKKKGSAIEQLHLYGLHTVNSALANRARKKHRLLVTENAWPRLDQQLIERAGVSVEECPASQLDQMVGADAVHQGVILVCDPLEMLDSSELFHLASASLLLILDQITDPHNVGAILRSAVAMNVDAVLVTNRNSATESAVLAKSASGALDLVKLVQLRHLSKGIEELNGMGFVSIGLDSEGPLVLEDTFTDTKATKLALVLGSEGKGLRQQTRETCTALARLDMPGAIKSLNVSNAAALSLYAASRYLRMESR